MTARVKDAHRHAVTTEEALRVCKVKLERAKQVLLQHGLVTELNVQALEKAAEQHEDEEGLADVDKLRKALLLVTQDRSVLEKQLRTQKTIRLENLRAFQHDRQACLHPCGVTRVTGIAGADQQDTAADRRAGHAEGHG